MKDLKKIAAEIRYLMIEVLRPNESHHFGSSFSAVEIVTFLYFKILNVYPQNPKVKERDIFILQINII